MKLKNNSLLLVIHLLLYPLLTIIYAQDSLYLIGTITGESTTQRIGPPKGIGDVNGDGYDDFIITMKTGNIISDQGIVKLYFGSSNFDLNADVIFHYPGSDTKNDFGGGCGVGDVNNDGYDDFVLYGSFGDWGFPKGKVFLYLGGETIDTIPVAEFYEPWIQDYFGQTTKLGDINKDGYDDFAIGSSYNWTDGKGYVYLFWGGDTISWERSITFTSDTLEDNFGVSIANIGDINYDGFDDIAIGVPGGLTGGADTGKVYIYYGGTQMNNSPDTILMPGNIGFGRVIKNAGDLNGDGIIDFCIAPGPDILVFTNQLNDPLSITGCFNCFDTGGNVNKDGYSDLIVDNKIYLGEETFDTVYNFSIAGFSSGISFAGDINGDEYDELFAFDWNWPNPENPVGKVFVYSYNKISDVQNETDNNLNNFQLYQNHPNPFNPKTIISWRQSVRSKVEITVYDLLGSEVITLIDEEKTAGNYEIEFDASNYHLSSGVYFCELKIKRSDLLIDGVRSQRIKMVLIK